MDGIKGFKVISRDSTRPLYNRGRFVIRAEFEKVEEDERRISGFASVEEVDKQGDLIILEAFEKAVERVKSDGELLPLMYSHTSAKIGTIDQMVMLKDVSPRKFWISAKIKAAGKMKLADEAWKDIKDKKLKAFSIGGMALSEVRFCNDKGSCFNKIDDIELYEVSVVETPANEKSLIMAIKCADFAELEVKEYPLEKDQMTEITTLIRDVESLKSEIGRLWNRIYDIESPPPEGGPVHLSDEKPKELPVAKYESLDACIAANQDKDDPAAFCASAMEDSGGSDEGNSEEKMIKTKADEEPKPEVKEPEKKAEPPEVKQEPPKDPPAPVVDKEKEDLKARVLALEAELSTHKQAADQTPAQEPPKPEDKPQPERRGVVPGADAGEPEKPIKILDIARRMNDEKKPFSFGMTRE